MLELHDATELAEAVRHGDSYAHWAPGDATLYRVTLLRQARFGLEALDHTDDLVALLVLVGDHGFDRHLLISAPRADHDLWSPVAFVRAFDVEYAGWWAGVRPVLAALGWTNEDHASLTYDPRDNVEVAQALDELRELSL